MKKSFYLALLTALFALTSLSQTGPAAKQAVLEKPAAIVAAANVPLALAKATLEAHGGDKLKKLRSLVMKGSVDLSVMGQALPGAFSTAISGDKYFFEINSPMQSLKQVYDGHQTYSSLQGFSLPPVTSLGFPVLLKVGDAGYTVTALGESAKKRIGFRITTPDGFYTDFFVDEKTSRIKGYESSYDVDGKIVTTSVVVDASQTYDGIIVPTKYSQRFDLGQLTAYANFNTKTVLVNSPIEDDAFAIPVK